ncbi:MAG: hypothetical protein Q9M13_04865 [Mariprofundales bacterium]|nr:hypothetical protein [Mariprofundales bacterium]
MIKKITTTICALCLWSAGATADETLSLKIGYANLNPSGSFASSNLVSNTRLQVDSMLAMQNSSGVTMEGALQFGDHRLSLNILPISVGGSKTLTTPITFAGKTYNIGTNINSSFKSTIYDLGYTYFFINMDDLPSRLQLGVEFTLKLNQIKSSISSSAVGSSTITTTAPIPTVGLRGRIALADFVGLVGRIGYASVGRRGSYLDVDSQVEFSLLPLVGGYAGYHYIQLKTNSSNSFSDIRLSGPYLGAMVRF